MMRKLLSLVLVLALVFTANGFSNVVAEETDLPALFVDNEDETLDSMNETELLQYVEDSVYAYLDNEFSDTQYVVEDVSAIYLSREYLEELDYNSQSNIFFGYTLAEINETFEGRRYVFTCDNGETVVQEFQEIPDDTYEKIIRNIAIGAGVILVCVTVSVVAGGIVSSALASGSASAIAQSAATVNTASAVKVIFAASAKTAIKFAESGAIFGAATSAVMRGIETDWDTDEMLDAALLKGSEGFKWGAIGGAILGGAEKTFEIARASSKIPGCYEAEKQALEKYGGRKQVAYMNGQEVSPLDLGCVKPDIVCGNTAIEVKCFNLASENSLSKLKQVLIDEIGRRCKELPADMTQKIVLNVEGRNYSAAYVQSVVDWIHSFLNDIYPDIPIDIMGAML